LKDSPSELVTSLADQASGLVDKLLQLMGGLLGGGGEAPSPASVPSTPTVVLESFAAKLLLLVDELQHSYLHSYPWQINHLSEKVGGSIISGVPPPTSADTLVVMKGAAPAPSQTPLPVPSERHTAGVSPSGSSGSLGNAGTPVLLLGVLSLFAIPLWRGRFSWPSWQLLRPDSALSLVAERPG
jgi:hypothetical protein